MTPGPVLVVVETEDGAPSGISVELIAAATDIANGASEVVAICLGSKIVESIGRSLSARGANQVVLVDDPVFEPYIADAWVHELTLLAREYKPRAIIFPDSTFGADAAPRLAFRLETAVVTGCIGVDNVDGETHWTRSCYGGNAREVVTLLTEPGIATVRARSFDPLPEVMDAAGNFDQRSATVSRSNPRTWVTKKSENKESSARLETANIVVSGGRGLGGPPQFEQLEELADLLGGAAGASRVACDLGWCPASWQVGLSGKTVAPQLYVALGISGAAQHLAGCGNSGVIVAVNTDPEAEIFKSARFGIVADCTEFLPAFIQEVRKIRSET